MTAILLLLFLACAAPAPAQEPLACGVPLQRTLPLGGVQTFNLTVPSGVKAVIQTSAVSPDSFGPRRMVLTGPGGEEIENTSTGIIRFTGRAGTFALRVSQNSNDTGGVYTVSLNIVSPGAANCGRPLECGATPDGAGFRLPGEVDSYQVELVGGVPARVKANYLTDFGDETYGRQPRLWIFDPSGTPITSAGTCFGTTPFTPSASGIYTALVFACGLPVERDYRIEISQPDPVCPQGPTITYFGVANAANVPIEPSGFDAAGRPIYYRPVGADMSLVVEARANSFTGRRPGLSTVPNGDQEANLQVILSNNLGDGDSRVCDIMPPDFGGVPLTFPFTFEPLTQVAREHIHDMGCRFNNGQGAPEGRTQSDEACTTRPEGDFAFVDRGSSIQYCAQIASAWEFLDGSTIVAARAQDTGGNFGAPREIVVRVGSTPTSTPTPTATPRGPTATRTPSPTNTMSFTQRATNTETRTVTPSRTRTLGPPGTPTHTATPNGCPGDCGEDGVVRINELTLMLNIAFGNADISQCFAGDADADGEITVGDLVRGVTSLLEGCS